MSKVLILKNDRPDEESSAYSSWKALDALGVDEYSLLEYRDLRFSIKPAAVRVYDKQGNDLADYDLVYIRDFHGYEYERNALALYLQHNNTRFINEDVASFQDISKLTQYMRLVYAGVSVPRSLYTHQCNLSEPLEDFDFPVVVKSIDASNGSHNELVSDGNALSTLAIPKPIIQEYLPNDYDYRVIVADDAVLLAYKRIRHDTSSHRNNVAEGARREVLETVPEDIAAIAVKAAGALHRNLAGVDVLQHKETKQLYVLEVNYNFGMQELNDGIAQQYYQRLAAYLHKKANN